jgi:hypothetical protein
LAAIASVGGGASIPLVTRTLSEQSGALVVTAPRPHLTAAVGAALRAARGPGDSETALAPTAAGSALDAMTVADIPRAPASAPALAWSEADDDSGIMPIRPGEYDDEPASGAVAPLRARPRRDLTPEPVVTGVSQDAWYRRPLVVAIGTALAVLAIVAGVLMAIRHTSGNATTPSVSTTPGPATSEDVSGNQAPASNPPSSTAPDTSTAPSTTSETPTTTTTTEAPTTSSQPPTTTTEGPQRPDRPRVPREPGGRLFPEPGGR